ncbi:hypothetical protein NNC19_09915 [Clostridium sp. SHJSY1]|uniref:hypothetical protein n=1 Tax=Clostridium sp. SHJSY1 TaxID=2942483 RepID=UPI00287713ED|nr:hypothetical protein [Clostridium sp. SHJSY1]MDS0525994.1 hypothetical protein [Clostridium sp. SHJSY1]
MDFNGWSNFEDLLKACGYTNPNNSETKNNPGCFDIPNGFQNLNPELFVAISGILGEIISGNIPFNVQNALGNWFELLGQVILTYNAQQQYFQGGPGRYFCPNNYNVNNPFCNTNQNSSTQNSQNSSITKRIDELESHINTLMTEIEKLQNKINSL